MHRTLTILTILTAAALTTGCTASGSPAPTPPPSTAAPAPTPVESSDQRPTLGTDAGGDFATLQSQKEAADVALATMTAFVTHERPYDAWWADLSQHLTPEAAMVWEFTDPRLVEANTITGPATVVDAPSSTLVTVDVPTDAGIWRLDVVKFVEVDADGGGWQVFSLQPPETF